MSPTDRRLDSIPEDAFIANIIAAISAGRLSDAVYLRDSFGRDRVSLPFQEIDIKLTNGLCPGELSTYTDGGGTVAHATGESHAKLTVSANGDRAILRTRVPQRYRAGQSLLLIPTSIVESPDDATVLHQIGYFNETDGIFLEITGGVATLVVEDGITSTSVRREQADWNKDTFDGNGPSGYTMDWSESVLMALDVQYLGIGQVRMGFERNGALIWAHWEDFSNRSSTGPYMTSANLHLGWSIKAIGAPAGPVTMRAICGTVIREGGAEEPVSNHVADRPVTSPATIPASQAWTSLVSVRMQDVHKLHSSALPGDIALFTVSAENIAWRVLRLSEADVPAAILAGAWTPLGSESVCEKSLVVDSTIDITKGKTYAQSYGAGGSARDGSPVTASLFDTSGVGLTDSGGVTPVRDVLILAAAKLDNSGDAIVHGSLQVTEVR